MPPASVVVLGGRVSGQGVCLPRRESPTPHPGQTDACENITLPHTFLRPVMIWMPRNLFVTVRWGPKCMRGTFLQRYSQSCRPHGSRPFHDFAWDNSWNSHKPWMGPAAGTVPGGGSCRENAWPAILWIALLRLWEVLGVRILLFGTFPLTYFFATKINFYTKWKFLH